MAATAFCNAGSLGDAPRMKLAPFNPRKSLGSGRGPPAVLATAAGPDGVSTLSDSSPPPPVMILTVSAATAATTTNPATTPCRRDTRRRGDPAAIGPVRTTPCGGRLRRRVAMGCGRPGSRAESGAWTGLPLGKYKWGGAVGGRRPQVEQRLPTTTEPNEPNPP